MALRAKPSPGSGPSSAAELAQHLQGAARPRASAELKEAEELVLASPWHKDLTSQQRRRVLSGLTVRDLPAGAYAWKVGQPVDCWVGVVAGLIKLSAVSEVGKETTFLGIGRGGWIGEASLMRMGARWYDAVALQDSRIACIPRSTFHWLVQNSLPFSHAVLQQVSERLVQTVDMIISSRLLQPDALVARCLASLCHTRLDRPGRDGFQIDISQEELGNLAGLSRQRVNHAIKKLAALGLLRVRPGGVAIPDPQVLWDFAKP